MRDRLIELIDDFIHTEDVKWWYSAELDEQLADYLLENGVIVPPCKVGDTVYVIYEKKIYEAVVDQLVVANYLPSGRRIRIRAEIEVEDLFYCDGRKTTYGVYRDWQDDIFLTKEEAEEALKGGAE